MILVYYCCVYHVSFSFVFQLGLIADDEDAFRNYGGIFFFFFNRERCPAGAVRLFTATVLQGAFFRDLLYFRF